jgi:hypothetical protein
MLISVDGISKNQMEPGQERVGVLQCCHIVLYQEIFDQNRPVCWSIFVKEKPTAGSPFFGPLSSHRIPKATKDVNVNLRDRNFLHVAISVNTAVNSLKLHERIPGCL